MAKKPPIVSVADAAALLGISDRQVRNLIAGGTLAAIKIGRDYIIQRADVLAVPKTRKPGPKPRPVPTK